MEQGDQQTSAGGLRQQRAVILLVHACQGGDRFFHPALGGKQFRPLRSRLILPPGQLREARESVELTIDLPADPVDRRQFPQVGGPGGGRPVGIPIARLGIVSGRVHAGNEFQVASIISWTQGLPIELAEHPARGDVTGTDRNQTFEYLDPPVRIRVHLVDLDQRHDDVDRPVPRPPALLEVLSGADVIAILEAHVTQAGSIGNR